MRGGVVLDEADLVKMGRVRSCEPWQGILCYPKGGGKFTERFNQGSRAMN